MVLLPQFNASTQEIQGIGEIPCSLIVVRTTINPHHTNGEDGGTYHPRVSGHAMFQFWKK